MRIRVRRNSRPEASIASVDSQRIPSTKEMGNAESQSKSGARSAEAGTPESWHVFADDDEAQEADVTRAGGEYQQQPKRRKRGQQDTGPGTEIENESAEDLDEEDDDDEMGTRS
jgi:hypothetical protein